MTDQKEKPKLYMLLCNNTELEQKFHNLEEAIKGRAEKIQEGADSDELEIAIRAGGRTYTFRDYQP